MATRTPKNYTRPNIDPNDPVQMQQHLERTRQKLEAEFSKPEVLEVFKRLCDR